MHSTKSLPDPLLIKLIKAKKREGAEALFDQYAKVLSLVLFRITGNKARTDELLEKTFVTIWLTIDQFNEQDTSFLAWIIAITKEKANEVQETQVITFKPMDRPLENLGFRPSV